MVIDLRSLPLLLVLLVTPILGALPSSKNALVQHTTSGVVEGFVDNKTISGVTLHKWLGMRYAQDTSGLNRWKPPQAVVPELGAVFNASEYGPACLQGR
jgi:carboxylesterase type B